jgi:hypothetical protein
LLKRLGSLGLALRQWQTVKYEEHKAIGRFEGTVFDPPAWKPRVPTAAFRHAQPEDLFWAARRVTAFSDEMIRAIVKTGEYSDPDAERHLADVLIQRRDKIGAAYLVAVNPLVNVSLSPEGRLTFENAAVATGVAAAPAGGYRVRWARFDNVTGAIAPIGESTVAPDEQPAAPGPLPLEAGAFVRVEMAATAPPHEKWARPVRAFFRRGANGWSLVGLDRNGE